MIISHKYKFIFLKTNKTAGTSIEIALSKFCGPKDIISKISPADEETRKRLNYRGPQNHLSPFWEYSLWDAKTFLRTRKKKVRFYNHIGAKEVKSKISPEQWNSYFKFCIERNPWDRVVSLYYWRNQSEPRPSISDFINSKNPLALKELGYHLYTIDGMIAVDKVCRFENLNDDLEEVRKRIGIPEKLELPKAKSIQRTDKRSYRDILTADDAATIAKIFSEEISLFNYEW